MEVDASCSSSQHYSLEIDQLFEAFGSAFSIEYIVSTYIQANRDADMAGEILCELQASGASTVGQSKEDADKSPRVSPESCNSSGSQLHSFIAEGNSKALDLGEGPVLRGLVAGITGKGDAKTGSSTSDNGESNISEFSSKTSSSSGGVTTETAHKDIDEFVFKMLGEGFQLDMEVIHEVLSACGYDMEKSMETLLDQSASTLGKSDDILIKAPEVSSQSYVERIDLSCEGKSQNSNSVRPSKKKNKVKNALEKELLQSLFTVPNRPEDEPKKYLVRKETSGSGRFGRVVTKPLEDPPVQHKTLYVTPLQTSKEDEDEDNFHVLSQAVNEHWATMKEYYKASCEAFVKGDYARATRLMEQGHFFSKKAREVDSMSLQMIMEPSEEDELLLDFSIHEPKESVQQLKSQLVIMSGIPSIPCLKVKLGNGEGGAKEGSRKRMILKLLEKESIKWTEMDNGQIISIRVDEIEPNSLSFSK